MKFFRDDKISILSPVECEQLQAFRDNWTNILPTAKRRYKTLGNVVTTVVVGKIVLEIKKAIS